MLKCLTVVVLFFATAGGCAAHGEPDDLRLASELSRRATELQSSDQSTAIVEYVMTADADSIVTFVPSTGLRKDRLPPELTSAQLVDLNRAADMFPNEPRIAVIWPGGLSGSTLGPVDVLAQRVLSVPKEGRISVQIEKQPAAGSQYQMRINRVPAGGVC